MVSQSPFQESTQALGMPPCALERVQAVSSTAQDGGVTPKSPAPDDAATQPCGNRTKTAKKNAKNWLENGYKSASPAPGTMAAPAAWTVCSNECAIAHKGVQGLWNCHSVTASTRHPMSLQLQLPPLQCRFPTPASCQPLRF